MTHPYMSLQNDAKISTRTQRHKDALVMGGRSWRGGAMAANENFNLDLLNRF